MCVDIDMNIEAYVHVNSFSTITVVWVFVILETLGSQRSSQILEELLTWSVSCGYIAILRWQQGSSSNWHDFGVWPKMFRIPAFDYTNKKWLSYALCCVSLLLDHPVFNLSSLSRNHEHQIVWNSTVGISSPTLTPGYLLSLFFFFYYS